MSTKKDWQVELIEAHPNLFHPPIGKSESAEGYPECEYGWLDLLQRACARIERTLGERDRLQVRQVKQKFGVLRFYWDGHVSDSARKKIDNAVDLAESRSACTCEICGAEGRLYKHRGFLLTACCEHAVGEPVRIKSGLENLRIVRAYEGNRLTIVSCRRYDRETDSFTDVEPASLGIHE